MGGEKGRGGKERGRKGREEERRVAYRDEGSLNKILNRSLAARQSVS